MASIKHGRCLEANFNLQRVCAAETSYAGSRAFLLKNWQMVDDDARSTWLSLFVP